MTKKYIDFKLEAHMEQEELQPQTVNTPPSQKAWLIFSPLLALVLAAGVFVGSFFGFSSIKIIFFLVASVSIFTYSYYAFEIHNIDKINFVGKPWHVYNQYWFNGLGAFMGWFALYILLFYRIDTDFNLFARNLNLQDFALALIAFFGVTGHFPLASLLGKVIGK